MKRKSLPYLLLGGFVLFLFAGVPTIRVHAQCQGPTGAPIECPPEEEKERPTIVYPSFTPTSTETPTPTSTSRPTATFTSTPTPTTEPSVLGVPPFGAEDTGPEPFDLDFGDPIGNLPQSWFDVFLTIAPFVLIAALVGMFIGNRFGQKRGKGPGPINKNPGPTQHPPEPGLDLPSPESHKFMKPGDIRGFNPQPEPPAHESESHRLVNPAEIRGFNPQPEPPAHESESHKLVNPVEIRGFNPQPEPPAHPPEPGLDTSEHGIIDDNQPPPDDQLSAGKNQFQGR